MKKNKAAIAIAAGAALVLTLGAYLIWGKNPKKDLPKPKPNPNPNPNPVNISPYSGIDAGYATYSDVVSIPSPTSSYPKFKVRTNTGANLNVRSTPSTSGSIVASLSNGAVIFARPSSSSGWHEYSADGNTRTGYISSTYLIPA